MASLILPKLLRLSKVMGEKNNFFAILGNFDQLKGAKTSKTSRACVASLYECTEIFAKLNKGSAVSKN